MQKEDVLCVGGLTLAADLRPGRLGAKLLLRNGTTL